MEIKVTPFQPGRATQEELGTVYDITSSSYLADFPNRSFTPYESFAEQFCLPTSHNGPERAWAAWNQRRIVGVVKVAFPELENRQHAITGIRVRPQDRRQRIGTSLMRAVLPDLRAAGRSIVTGRALRSGGDGEAWAMSLGFRKVEEIALQILSVAETDTDLWQVPVPAGFRAQAWNGRAPSSLVEGYAHAMQAMADAPTADSSLLIPAWTAERVRETEAEVLGRGCELRVVVAVHEGSGAVAALTSMEVSPARPDTALQLYTAVPPGFRGHGLGRFVKATMMRKLLADRPQIRQVLTNSDTGNTHMIAVNRQVGYRVDHVVCDVETGIDSLERELRRAGLGLGDSAK